MPSISDMFTFGNFIVSLSIFRDYSRVNFVYTLLSKRKLQWFVDRSLVTGWDDPRFPTVRGILRRGMTVEALKRYILMQGASKNTIMLEWDKLWTMNKQLIDPIAPKHVAISSKNMFVRFLARFTPSFLTKHSCIMKLSNGPGEPFVKEMAKHKKNESIGTKQTHFSNEIFIEYDDAVELSRFEEVTLMDWGNVVVEDVVKSSDNIVSLIHARLHLEGDFKKTKKKLTWFFCIQFILTLLRRLSCWKNLVPVQLQDYDYLITKKKLEENDTLDDFVNPLTEFISFAKGDANMSSLRKGDIIQLERRGYYICDQPLSESSPINLILIPDGRASSIALKFEHPKVTDASKEKKDVSIAKKDASEAKKDECIVKSPVSVELKGIIHEFDSSVASTAKTSQHTASSVFPPMYSLKPIVDLSDPFPDISTLSTMYKLKSVNQ